MAPRRLNSEISWMNNFFIKFSSVLRRAGSYSEAFGDLKIRLQLGSEIRPFKNRTFLQSDFQMVQNQDAAHQTMVAPMAVLLTQDRKVLGTNLARFF